MVLDILGEAMKEIAVEDDADFQQLVGAEIALSELSAKVLPRAAHLPREPSDAPLLMRKFGFDEVSDMWGFVHKKGVNPFLFCLYHPLGIW